jgi:hypothetical protein
LLIWFWLKIFFSFPWNYGVVYGHVLRGPQATQVNEEPAPESSLDLKLTQHLHDENPKPWKVCVHLEVNPPRTWYYRIFPNYRTLVILLHLDPASSDEPKIVCEGCYETKDTSIFAWSSILGVGHYRWLHDPICHMFPNNKADYLVRTIRHILDFLHLWTITMA